MWSTLVYSLGGLFYAIFVPIGLLVFSYDAWMSSLATFFFGLFYHFYIGRKHVHNVSDLPSFGAYWFVLYNTCSDWPPSIYIRCLNIVISNKWWLWKQTGFLLFWQRTSFIEGNIFSFGIKKFYLNTITVKDS